MFSVSTINNKKVFLLALLFPTVINCSMFPTSLQNTIIDEKYPKISVTLIAGAGLTTAGLIMLKSEDPDHKALGMLSLASLGVGYAAYKCLNYFTPTGRYNEVKKIIETEKEKAIWRNTDLFLEKNNSQEKQSSEENSEEKSINFKQLFKNITHAHYAKLDKTHLFIEKNLVPSFNNMKQAETLIDKTIEHLDLIESQNPGESKDTKSTLLEELKKDAVVIKDILDRLVQIEDNIKDSNTNPLLKKTAYHKQAEHFNNKEMNNLQKDKIKTKLENLKQQNSYATSISNLIMSNPLYIQILAAYIQLFYAKIISTFGMSA